MNADVTILAETITAASQKVGNRRLVIGIAGPPGSGKSTMAAALAAALIARDRAAVILPMDGFHLANRLLEEKGLLSRKGAPETFDRFGFASALKTVRLDQQEVFVPEFDREQDLAIAAAISIAPEDRIVIVEGNYLLLDEPGWRDLRHMLDFTVFLDPPLNLLEERLVRRWRDHGLDAEAAEQRARENDIVNAKRVLAHRLPATRVFDTIA
ncbi:nucleoside/nucleotide kinase family protein [Martelella sp. HB161492]|uniref:nucleoside/nucleotide kinase family protein n=1 Tax=Martelella sp. HB161492 TaxID=2720726 RepID=UPI001590B251|nr:nucleoside/nucleotide kinase family protein [Martelella sp. HB161492]